MNAVKFYLTFPQCGTDMEEALKRIVDKFDGNLKWALVCSETHEDGSPHLHAGIWLKKKLDIRDEHYFDFIGGKHGHYKVMKKPLDCIKYLIKDGHWCSCNDFDPEAYIRSREKKKSYQAEKVAALLKTGKSIREIDDSGYAGFILTHLQQVRNYQTWRQAEDVMFSSPSKSLMTDPIEDYTAFLNQGTAPRDPRLWEEEILNWLKTSFSPTTPFGRNSLHLRIIGSTGIGKSTFVSTLYQYLRIYPVPMDEEFYDSFNEAATDLLV